MASYYNYFWKKSPFIRLLLFLIAGIMLQWHLQLDIRLLCTLFFIIALLSISFFFTSLTVRFKLGILNGIVLSLLIALMGALLVWQKDIRHDETWIGNKNTESATFIVTLDEPPVEKTKSIKANAKISYLHQNDTHNSVSGKIIIYFKKDIALLSLPYGTQIVFNKKLQEIKNSGNPGGFDYKRYSLFNGITHQVYLKPGEFEILNDKNVNSLRQFIYNSREWVLKTLRKNITSEKELGLAEALLIGYKDDLDQSLVQSYTNTGVVHVIAISGLHLGLIYWLLLLICKPLQKKRVTKWLTPVLVVIGLWLFSLLAGAQPSVLRSAVMFTCIVLGENIGRRSSIYNTLAFSAFILLCINPYWLWDVGFQLSYAAVLSIIIFMKPIYNLIYTKNKIIDFIWKINAVTFAAQILTIPVSIYHFHQFPFYFFLTNFLAVPLSSIILIGEIFLCAVSFIPSVALLTGKIITWLIRLMNTYIERVELIPYSLWDNLQISILQAMLFIIAASTISYWLMEKSKKGLITGLTALVLFFILRTNSIVNARQQEKIIVYNVPQKQAVDFFDGQYYVFAGDSSLLADDFARNFHLKPARIFYRVGATDSIPGLIIKDNFVTYKSKHILLIDSSSFYSTDHKQTIDLLIISRNPSISFNKISKDFQLKQVVFDGSVPAWKTSKWKKECDTLGIPYYDVITNGAFVMNLR